VKNKCDTSYPSISRIIRDNISKLDGIYEEIDVEERKKQKLIKQWIDENKESA